jgi:hypothetical protein
MQPEGLRRDFCVFDMEMPLPVTFSSCEQIINYEQKPPRNFYGLSCHHNLWIRNATRMVMSVRLKKFLSPHPSSPSNSIAVHHPI